MKKVKCRVCGTRFYPYKENVYVVQEKDGIITGLTTPRRMYNVIDCPKCGCQIVLKRRLEAATADEQ